MTNRSECLNQCQGNDSCNFNCDYSAAACTNSCPCFENCPAGCDGCETSFCSCYDYESNSDYIACLQKFEVEYNKCLINCPSGDVICLASCARELEQNTETCPCRSECPSGCPCPSYDCSASPSTTPVTTQTTTLGEEKRTVLILNTYWELHTPILTDNSGRYDINFLMVYGDETSAFRSCSVQWRNEMYIFGGKDNFSRQISKLEGCEILRVGTLGFDLKKGACTTIGDRRLYLCFNYTANDSRTCRFASGPLDTFTATESSIFEHQGIRIAASDCDFVANRFK